MRNNAPITRVDVAQAAGVSVFTVSLVMRGLAGVAPETRLRVQQAATELGYRANPMAAMLAQQRRRKKRELPSVAVLDERQHSAAGIRVAMGECGLNPVFRRPSQFASPEMASRQLWHEGVVGVLVEPDGWPWSTAESLRFEWRRFAAVKLSRQLPELRLHLVRHSPFDYMEETISRVVAHGFRNIGIVMLDSSGSPRDDDARWGVLYNWRERKLVDGAKLRWFTSRTMMADGQKSELKSWLREEPMEALIIYHWWQYNLLREVCGVRQLKALAIASVLTNGQATDQNPIVSGCDLRVGEYYAKACQLLNQQLQRGEQGMPTLLTEHVVEPIWIAGDTFPSVTADETPTRRSRSQREAGSSSSTGN